MSPPSRSSRALPHALLPAGIVLGFLLAALVSVVRAGVAGTIRVDEAAVSLLLRIVLGLAFAVAAGLASWCYLRTIDRVETFDVRTLLKTAFAVHLAAALALPLTSNDLFSNLAYGRLARLGMNPYFSTPRALAVDDPFRAMVGQRWLDAPIVYGPLVAMSDALATMDQLWSSIIVFKLMMLATSLAGVAMVAAYLRTATSHLDKAALVVIAWNPLLAWEVSAQAHNDGIMVAAMFAFVWAARRDRDWLAWLALAIAFFAKFAVAPLLGLYLVHQLRRTPARVVGMMAVFAAVGVLLFLPFWRGLDTLTATLGAVAGDAARTGRSFTDVLYWSAWPFGPGVQQTVFHIARATFMVLLAAIGVRAIFVVRTLEDVLRESLIFFLAYVLVAAPTFHPWYATWLLPLVLGLQDRRWLRPVAIYSVLSLVQYGLAVIDSLVVIAVNVITLRQLYLTRDALRPDAPVTARTAL